MQSETQRQADAAAKEREKMSQLFTQNGITNYLFTTERYAQWDGLYVNSKDTSVCFEVKVRNFNHDKYYSTMIEKSKFDYLTSTQQIGEPRLFVFFEDNTYFTTKLEKDNPDYFHSKEWLPRTTTGNSDKVLTDVVYIPVTKVLQING